MPSAAKLFANHARASEAARPELQEKSQASVLEIIRNKNKNLYYEDPEIVRNQLLQ